MMEGRRDDTEGLDDGRMEGEYCILPKRSTLGNLSRFIVG